MMITAESLSHRASSYKIIVYQVIAKRYLFESYTFTGLPDKAFEELEEGMKLTKKLNETDSLTILTRAEMFIAYSNYCMLEKDYKKQLEYIKMSGKELEKLSNNDYKQRNLYRYYSNLANAYYNINQDDSVKFYASLSESKDKDYKQTEVKRSNLSNLGKVAMKEGEYEKALSNFKEAEKLNTNKDIHLNIEDLYHNIILAYQMLDRDDSAKIYQSKKDSLKFNISENKNKSLHKIINEKEKNPNKIYLYIAIVVFILMIFIISFIVKKNRNLANQEKISQKYLKEISQIQNGDDYSTLMEMLKRNDPAFMTFFMDVFSDFSEKILKINPKITPSEIEFCALLKLKIPTKNIARYKFIEPKTVRNKKYVIKKKLNIPKEVDIYQWFDNF